MTTSTDGLDELCINTIRTLSMDAVQKANSGHPGNADGARAARLRALHAGHAAQPERPGLARPRPLRALGCGHASMLLYSMLYLTGYGLTLDDLKNFRQLGSADRRPPRVRPRRRASRPPPARSARASRTPSGMALAERMLAARFNRDGHELDRPPHLRDRQRRRPAGGRRLEACLARRPPRARPADRRSTTTTTSRSTATPSSPSPRTSASASRPTAGTSRTSARTSRSSARGARIADAQAVERPAVADHRAHAHRLGSPNKQDTDRRTARRSARTRCELTKEVYGWPATGAVLRAGRGARALPGDASSAAQAGRGASGSERWPTLRDADLRRRAAELERSWTRRLPDGLGRRRPRRSTRTTA